MPALAGKLPNMRAMYRAAPGDRLAHADYSQLELNIARAVNGDEVLAAALASGDVYAEDAKDIFGLARHLVKCTCPNTICVLPELHIKPSARQASKIGHLAFQYGAGLATFYGQLLEEDRTLTFKAARLIYQALRARYWRTVEWWGEELERVRTTGYSESRIMFRRRVYPRLPPITEIANYPIQATAADVANRAIIRLHQALRKIPHKPRIVVQLHDAFDVEHKDLTSIQSQVHDALHTAMEQPETIEGRQYVFKVKVTSGIWWSEV